MHAKNNGLSLLEELEVELKIAKSSNKPRNIPVQVTRYLNDGTNTVTLGGNLLLTPAKEIQASLFPRQPSSSTEKMRTELSERYLDGPKQVRPGGVLVFEQCIENSDGALSANWATSLFSSADMGDIIIDFATVKLYETNESRTKPVREVYWLDTRNSRLVDGLAALEQTIAEFLTTTAQCSITTPGFVIRAFDQDSNALAIEWRQQLTPSDGNSYIFESVNSTLARFWQSEQGKIVQRVLASPNGLYQLEVIRSGIGYFTKESNEHLFDTQGKIRQLTTGGHEHQAALLRRTYGQHGSGLFCKSIIGIRQSPNKNRFYHYTKPVAYHDPFYRLEHIPTDHFHPSSLKELYPLGND